MVCFHLPRELLENKRKHNQSLIRRKPQQDTHKTLELISMCILLTTNANKDYPFVLLSNRDEYFKRATQTACLHPYQNHQILSPLDMARVDHGSWIALNPETGKFSILVNFREGMKDVINPISRGVLPLDYVTSKSMSKTQFLNELVLKYNDSDLLRKIGGFNLMFGDLISNRFDIISNKNDSDFKIFSSMHEYHGLSNSAFDEPWKKVEIGTNALKELTTKYNEGNGSVSQDEFIEDLFGVLSLNTMGNITEDYQANYENIKGSVFVPPLKVRDYNRNNTLAGKYYGTRTQTVILVDKFMKVIYVEKNLHSSDDLSEKPQISRFEFSLGDTIHLASGGLHGDHQTSV